MAILIVSALAGPRIDLKKQMNATTAAIQGSGWGWLGFNPSTKKLDIVTTPNQDPLLSASTSSLMLTFASNIHPRPVLSTAHVPIIGIDIWEHAFYLQYKNVKPDVSLRPPLHHLCPCISL